MLAARPMACGRGQHLGHLPSPAWPGAVSAKILGPARLPCGRRPTCTQLGTWVKCRNPMTSRVKGVGIRNSGLPGPGSLTGLQAQGTGGLGVYPAVLGHGRHVLVVLSWLMEKARPQPSALQLGCGSRTWGTPTQCRAGPETGASKVPIPQQRPASSSRSRSHTKRGFSSGESCSRGWLQARKMTP